jgi:iron complex outermembrane receptor protein
MKQSTIMASAIAAALMAAAGGASAQTAAGQTDQADASNAKSLQTITVTGTHIRSVDVETAQPIYSMDRQAIQATGLTNVSDVLARMPSIGTPDITPQDTLGDGPDAGGRYVSIRNLGAARTLVLVNGHRWSTSLSGLTDISTIPVSMIDRIDVLKDGASSVYGSDAIGGVVNIITRERFEGAEVNAYYGANGNGDGRQKNVDFTWGHNTAKSSLIVGAAYQELTPMWDRTRPLTSYLNGPRHPDDGLALGPWGRVQDPDTGLSYVIDHGATDTANLANYHLYDPSSSADKYSANQVMTFRAGNKLKNLFVQERYRLTDDITLHGAASYSTRDTSAQLAGYPLSSSTTGITIDPDNAYNPFPGNATTFWRRTVEMPRTTWSNTRLAHADVGVDGNFSFLGHDWNWDAGYTFSHTDIRQVTTGNINLVNAEKALGPTAVVDGQLACANAADRAAGCVPWNILAGPGGTPASVWNYVNAVSTARQVAQTDDVTANVGGGLFDLPAGTVNIAGGLEHRREKGSYRPDPNDTAGLTTNLASAPTHGRYDVNEAYLELDVPVLRDLPGAKEVGINLASRYSHYSSFGNTVNSKFSVRWRPFDDLLVRGTYAEGFRAPTIQDLYGGFNQTFDSYLDPCDSKFGAAVNNATVAARCGAAGVPANYRQQDQSGAPIASNAGGQSATPFLFGSNALLKPETSVTRTFGFVYSPHFVDGLDVSVDYYDIRLKNAITQEYANNILNFCYVQGVSGFCNGITRNSDGSLANVIDGPYNAGTITTDGYDVGVHYRLASTPFGRFRLGWDSGYLSKYQQTAGPGMASQELAGYMNGEQGLYRWRSNMQLDWDYRQFGASWTVRYYSGLKDSCYSVDPAIECSHPAAFNQYTGDYGVARKGAVTFNDVQLRYTAPWKGVFTFGVNNLFNKKGPLYYNVVAAGYGAQPYNPGFDIDRFFYLGYNQKF